MARPRTVSITGLRRKILRDSGRTMTKHTKHLIPISAAPDTFPKTPLMKTLEYKYNIKIEEEIFTGSLLDVVLRFNSDIDRTTISKWRKYIKEQIFFNQFKEV